MDLSGVFHFFSAIVFGLLIWRVYLVQQYRSTLLQLFEASAGSHSGKQQVVVDWPLRYLKRIAGALSVPFSGTGSLKVLSPRRIKYSSLSELLTAAEIVGIEYICLAEDNGDLSRVTIIFVLFKKIDHQEVWENRLSEDLGHKITIKTRDEINSEHQESKGKS
jgi:hypothetical protein